MDPQQPDINELISGMLDGELSHAEARRLDAEMKANPALQHRLDELAVLRSALLKGRPSGRLPKNFAARVVSLANERADELEDEVPVWLESGSNAVPISGDGLSSGNGRYESQEEYGARWWIPLASVCAAVCLGGLLFLLPKPSPEPLVILPPFDNGSESALLEGTDSENQTATAQELLQKSIASSESKAPPEFEDRTQKNDGFVDKGVAPKSSAVDVALLPPAKDVGDGLVVSDLASDKIENTLASSTNTSKATDLVRSDSSPTSVDNTVRLKRPNGSAPIVSSGKMLFAVSVDMDRVAFENNALDQIFTKHGIAAIEELAIDDGQLQSLLTTGLAGSVSHEGNSIILLKGTERSIGKAVLEIYAQYKDFPAIGINVLMGDAVKELERQFSTISVASAPVSKRLTVKNEQGVFSRFSQGKEKTTKHLNKGTSKPALLSQDGESLMLLLIREVD